MVHFLFDVFIGFGGGIIFSAYFPEQISKIKGFISDIVHRNNNCKTDKK